MASKKQTTHPAAPPLNTEAASRLKDPFEQHYLGLLQSNDPVLLEKYNKKLVELHYTSPFIYYNLIANLANRKQLDSALTLSSKAVAEFPGDENLKKVVKLYFEYKGYEYNKEIEKKELIKITASEFETFINDKLNNNIKVNVSF